MTSYRRNFVPGGTYFFTVNLADRRSRLLTEEHNHVGRVKDWPYSSFRRMVRLGVHPDDWAGDVWGEGGDLGERGWVSLSLNPSYAPSCRMG